MGKYIVELKKNETLYKAATRESDGTAYVYSAIGTPYTEPDLEQVRKEAYEEGYKTAKVQCNIQAEKDMREVGERHYQRGLADAKCGYENGFENGMIVAWECARKFMSEVIDARFRNNFMVELLECDNAMGAMKVYSASEAIEKIRQYEQEKEEIIDIDKNKVEALANDIGIHKLYALVKEIRGE